MRHAFALTARVGTLNAFGEDYLRARGVEVINLDSEECVQLMNEFIAAHPEIWNEDIGEN